MNRMMYKMTYTFGWSRWDTGESPPELLDMIKQYGDQTGHFLDLGCGTGTNAITLAKAGWMATGIDFVPSAIEEGKKKARQANLEDRVQLYNADVTRLNALQLPSCDLALDMGCFHGLSDEGRHAYVSGLAQILKPGGRYMLYAFAPRKIMQMSFGLTPDEVTDHFTSAFEIEDFKQGEYWPGEVYWYWLRRSHSERLN